MAKMFEQLQLPVGSLGQNWGAERLHDLFNRNGLSGQLISRGAVILMAWLA